MWYDRVIGVGAHSNSGVEIKSQLPDLGGMCLWVVTGLSLDIWSAHGKLVEQAALGFSANVRGKTSSSLWENARRKDGPGEGVRHTHWVGREDSCWGPLASKSWVDSKLLP